MERRTERHDQTYRFTRRPAVSAGPATRKKDTGDRHKNARPNPLLSALNNGDPPDLMLWGDDA